MPNYSSQRGFIPILVLIAIGVATLVGGSYAIKSEFIKFEKGEISLDMAKVQRQQSSPQSSVGTSPTNSKSDQNQPTPTPQLAPNKFTVEADTEKGQPGFTINPPAGWNKIEKSGFAAYFEAPEEDEYKMVGVSGRTQKSTATVQVRFLPLNNYKQLKEAGLSEIQILDSAVKSVKQSMDPANPTYLTDRRATFAGQDAQLIEAKVNIKVDTSQIEEYKDLSGANWDIRAYGSYLVRGNYLVAVAGTSLDSAWGKRAPAIQASINSFSFTKWQHMEYAVILIGILLVSPFILKIASSQNKKGKDNLRIIFLSLLAVQVISGLFNWETFQGTGKSGLELALAYPNSYLWIFFAVSVVQFLLLTTKKPIFYTVSVVLNFVNTIMFFAGMIILSNILGKQIVSFVSIGVIFVVLIGNVVGLTLINKDRNLFKKYHTWQQVGNYLILDQVSKISAPKQEGFVAPPILVIGAVVVGLIVIGIASGGLKGSFKITNNQSAQQPSEQASSQDTPTPTPTPAPSNSTMKVYSSADLNFSFEYPEGWKIDEKSDSVTIAIFDKGKAGNDAEAAISALSKPLGTSKDLQFSSIVDMQRAAIKQQFKNSDFARDEDMTLNGQKAHLFEYSGTFVGNPVKAFYVTLTDKDNVYAITALADADKWSKYGDDLKKAVDSFKLLK